MTCIVGAVDCGSYRRIKDWRPRVFATGLGETPVRVVPRVISCRWTPERLDDDDGPADLGSRSVRCNNFAAQTSNARSGASVRQVRRVKFLPLRRPHSCRGVEKPGLPRPALRHPSLQVRRRLGDRHRPAQSASVEEIKETLALQLDRGGHATVGVPAPVTEIAALNTVKDPPAASHRPATLPEAGRSPARA